MLPKKIICWLLWLTLAALALYWSLVPSLKQEILASSQYNKWNRHWAGGQEIAQIDMKTGLLPTNLPGPADRWAGSKAHALSVAFTAPPGKYYLELLFFDSHESAPPKLSLSLNGKKTGEIRLRAGKGLPPPYDNPSPLLTVRHPLRLDRQNNVFSITNESGSWAAPAKLRLTQGWDFNPARAGYLLLTSPRRLLLVAALLLGAVFFSLWSRTGLKGALASVALLTVSSLAALVAGEFLFREYLIRFPQARHLSVQNTRSPKEAEGARLSFIKMIKPHPDLEITYHLKPGLNGYFAGHPLRTNSLGMRGPEIDPVKKPGVLRIMGLGDSVLFGWGVAFKDTLLENLKRDLQDKLGKKVETLNLACPSYNTAVEAAVYKKIGRPLKPDVVVVLFVDNDFDMPSMMLEPVERWDLSKSHLVEQVRRRLALYWRDARNERDRVMVRDMHLVPHQQKLKAGSPEYKHWQSRLAAFYENMAGPGAVMAGFKDLAQMLGQDKALGIVVYYPNFLGPPKPEVAQALEVCRAAGLKVVDMGPVFAKYLHQNGLGGLAETIWVGPRDSHPNALGHRLMAQKVFEVISQNQP